VCPLLDACNNRRTIRRSDCRYQGRPAAPFATGCGSLSRLVNRERATNVPISGRDVCPRGASLRHSSSRPVRRGSELASGRESDPGGHAFRKGLWFLGEEAVNAFRRRGRDGGRRQGFIVSLPGFPSQLRRVCGLLLLARHVPRLPRLLLGLRPRLQLLSRLTTRRCSRCHVFSLSVVFVSHRGSERLPPHQLNATGHCSASRNREAEGTLLRLLRSVTSCGRDGPNVLSFTRGRRSSLTRADSGVCTLGELHERAGA
jgi:hypothetical protein